MEGASVSRDVHPGVSEYGLKEEAIGFRDALIVGIASTAPAYSLAAVIGLVVVDPSPEHFRRTAFEVGEWGLVEWTQENRSIENTDVVRWYVFGLHHITRPEDWPVMPVVTVSFWLKPVGFFDRNPAVDVPPSANGHCHNPDGEAL